jgi:uncharacterized coiled-coil DUF342 family protein
VKDLIKSLPSKPPKFHTLVHVGAGPVFDADLYAAVPAHRYVLVDADPDAVAELQRASDPTRFRTVEKLLAPIPGPQQLRRFNLPTLNGVFGLGALKSIYPRAREVGQVNLSATTLNHFLAEMALANGARHALVLSLPGLEADLLADLLAVDHVPLEWIFLSGAGAPLMENAKSLQEALRTAENNLFHILAQDHESNPLQPVAVLQRDRQALKLRSMRHERNDLRAKCADLEKNHQELVARHSSLATALEELQSRHSSLVAERDGLRAKARELEGTTGAAANERDVLRAKCADLEKNHQELVARHSSLAAALEELQSRHSSLVMERDGLQAKAREMEDTMGAAAEERDALLAKCADLEKNHQELVARHAALVASEKELTAARDKAAKDCDRARTEHETAAKERDALRKNASDHAIRIVELESQLADQAERQKRIDEEMAKAEGQLDMLKDLLRPALP